MWEEASSSNSTSTKKLFPSSTSTPVPVQIKGKRCFTQQQIVCLPVRKKKATHSWGTMVNFIFLHDFEKGLPKKEVKKQQLMEGMCVKIEQ